jgi:rhodanese-related sulfurtransferase
VVEPVDTPALGAGGFGRGGSNPSARIVVNPETILYPRLKELLADGAQLVEVLPPEEYAELHLPGAVSIPLKALDAQTTAQLDRRKAVVVYCWDGL